MAPVRARLDAHPGPRGSPTALARGSRGDGSDHRSGRALRRALRPRGGQPGPERRDLRLRCGRPGAWRRGHRGQPGHGAGASRRRRLGRRDGAGHDHGTARGECGRAVGAAGRADGRRGPPARADPPPLPRHGRDPGGSGDRRQHAGRDRPGGVHLSPARGRRGPAGHLRAAPGPLGGGRGAVGLRDDPLPGGRRADRPGAADGVPAVPRPPGRRDPEVGARPVHLHAGREPARRPGRRRPRLLGGLRLHGRVLAERRDRAGAGELDRGRRARLRRVRDGRGEIRWVCRGGRVSSRDDRPVLRPTLRDGLSERGTPRRPTAEDDALPRGVPGSRREVHGQLGPGGPELLRPGRGLHGDRRPWPLECRTDRGQGGRRGPHGGRRLRDRSVRPLRGDGAGFRCLARLPSGRASTGRRADPARTDAGAGGPTDGRPHGDPSRRGPVLADRLVLPPGLAPALVQEPSSGQRRGAPERDRRRHGLLGLRPGVAIDPRGARGRRRRRVWRLPSRSCPSRRSESARRTPSSGGSP